MKMKPKGAPMRHTIKTAFLFTFLLVVVCGLTPDAQAYTLSYKQTMKMPEGDVAVAHVWLKDGKMRIESGPEQFRIVSIHLKDGVYNMVPGQNVITKVAVPETSTGYLSDHEAYLNEIKNQGAVLKGTEEIAGKVCDIYEYTDPASGNAITSWISQEMKFPLKMVVNGPAGKVEMTYTDIKINKPIADDMFEIPEGQRIIDMAGMIP